MTDVTSYLSYLRGTVKRDIEKLRAIATEGEREYIENSSPSYDFGPGEIPTTIPPPPTHFEYAFDQPSRCTIPLAMMCLSIVELLGNLLSTAVNKDFQIGAKYFFNYAGITLSNEERELLREIFRNGLMHKFFPKGIEIGITYDSSLESRKELFVEDLGRIILNVNFLSDTVLIVLNKVIADMDIHQVIEKNRQIVSEVEFPKVQTVIGNYKRTQRLPESVIKP